MRATEEVLAQLWTESHNPSFHAIRAAADHDGELIDFCVPVNAYFPPAEMVAMVRDHLEDILKFYPDYADVHQQCIAELAGVAPQHIVAGNGSTEIITSLCRDAPGPIVTPIPTFGRWTDLPRDFGVPVHFIQRRREQGFALGVEEIVARARATSAAAVVVCNPDNPTGTWLHAAQIRALLGALKDLPLVIIDESFIDFSDLESAARLAVESDNAIVVKSLGKSLGWHGIRLGYAVANETIARALRTTIPYWNVNGLASFVLKNVGRFRRLYLDSFEKMARDRDYMLRRLRGIEGLMVYPSKANFFYCELPAGVCGRRLRDWLLQAHGIIVRECGNKVGSTPDYLRLAVREPAAVDRLVDALAQALAAPVHQAAACRAG